MLEVPDDMAREKEQVLFGTTRELDKKGLIERRGAFSAERTDTRIVKVSIFMGGHRQTASRFQSILVAMTFDFNLCFATRKKSPHVKL